MNEVDKLLQNSASKQKIDKDDEQTDGLRLESEFKLNFKSLDDDIQHIDMRLAHINKFIVNLETQVNNLRALIANDTNSAKRGSYYTLMNTCVELNARYEDLYLRCLDIKFKYRKEQDDLGHKVKRMTNIELPKAKISDGGGSGEMSSVRLSQLLKELAAKLDSTDTSTNKVFETLSELDTDLDYKL